VTGRKFAVVTGASTGIGFELASVAAKEGYDLLVVANESLIHAAAADFRLHGGDVQEIEADLSTVEGVDALLDATAGRSIDVLCANAGAGHGNSFLDQSFAQIRMTIDTNITGTVYLLHRVMTDMVERANGKVLVTGSIAGYVPGAFNAVYNATKAFIDNFIDAVRNELHDTQGVTLTTLMPGATETEFFARADMLETAVGKAKKGDPAKVAREGWDDMIAGEATVVPGLMNKIIVATSGLVPPPISAALHRKMAEPDDND
jgi:uncharacterized protein